MVAYLVPGATVLVGLSPFSETLQIWFAAGEANAPSLGGFLYLTVAALAAGMIVNAVRWAIVDTLHARTGLFAPQLDFIRLGENVEAYKLLIAIHYQHYQFHANMGIASIVAYASYRARLGNPWSVGWPDSAFVFLELIFWAASRDTLRKYYRRGGQLLATTEHSAKRLDQPSSRSSLRAKSASVMPKARQTERS